MSPRVCHNGVDLCILKNTLSGLGILLIKNFPERMENGIKDYVGGIK